MPVVSMSMAMDSGVIDKLGLMSKRSAILTLVWVGVVGRLGIVIESREKYKAEKDLVVTLITQLVLSPLIVMWLMPFVFDYPLTFWQALALVWIVRMPQK